MLIWKKLNLHYWVNNTLGLIVKKLFLIIFLLFAPFAFADSQKYPFTFVDVNIQVLTEFISKINKKPVQINHPIPELFSMQSSLALEKDNINDRFTSLLFARGYSVNFNNDSIVIDKLQLNEKKINSFVYTLKNITPDHVTSLLNEYKNKNPAYSFDFAVSSNSVIIYGNSDSFNQFKKLLVSFDVSLPNHVHHCSKPSDSLPEKLNLFNFVYSSGVCSYSSTFENHNRFIELNKYNDELINSSIILNSVTPDSMLELLKNLFPSSQFYSVKDSNILVFQSTANDKNKIIDFIRSVDVKAYQIYIDLYILQASSDFKKEVGLSLFGDVSLSADSSLTSKSFPVGSGFGFALKSDQVTSLFRFLQTDTESNLMSNPKIQVTNGKKYKLLSGQEVPFQTGSYTGSNYAGVGSDENNNARNYSSPFNTVNRKNVGLTVELTPFYFSDDRIEFNFMVELSAVIPNSRQTVGAVDLITSKKTIESSFTINNDDWLIISGLDEVSQSDNNSGLPFLSSIFGYSSEIKTNKSFFIIINAKKVQI